MGTPTRVPGATGPLPHRHFSAGGESYVYATETGGLFRADGTVLEALSSLASPGKPAVSPAVLAELRRAGLARAGTLPERVGRAVLPPFRMRTIVLMLTGSCNLACRYCYEVREEGCAPPARSGIATQEMPVETLRKSVAFLLDHCGESRNVSVVFFGGEPLLRFPLIRTVVRDARRMAGERGKNVSFSLTTNGTLVTPAIAGFLMENGVSVCVSIDGPPRIHDFNRSYASGNGSYGDVARGISYLVERKTSHPLAARVTLGRGAVGVRETFDHLRGLGFDEVGFAPASAAEGSATAPSQEELDLVLDGFRDLANAYAADVRERRMPAFSNLTQILAMVHRGDPMPYPCGAGIGMMAVDPSGAFYPCHRLCGVGETLGDPENGIAAGARARFLERARRRGEAVCGDCWARNFCSGGCYHDAYLRQGDPFSPSTHYCRWVRELFLLGLEAYARIQNETPTFMETMLGERGIA